MLVNLIIKVCACVLFPIAYPILCLARYYLYKWCGAQFFPLKEQIAELRRRGLPGWQEEAIALIRKNRQNNPFDELVRLRAMGVLDSKTEAQLDRAQDKVCIEIGTNYSSDKRAHIKVLYAQAMEIKQIYQGSCDVFIHAQASPWIVVPYLVKELWKNNLKPGESLKQFKPLRAPCATATPGMVEATCQMASWIPVVGRYFPTEGVAKFRDRPFQILTVWDSDSQVREELISADAYFCNHSRFESALHFLTNNVNILSDEFTIRNVAQEAITHYYPTLTERQKSNYSKQVVNTLKGRFFPCGNLFVICIPKDAKEIQYRAHPFGKGCDCHDLSKEREILNKLQKGILDDSTKCRYINCPVPQYRLYAPTLMQPDSSRKIFHLTPLSHESRKGLKSRFKEIAGRIMAAAAS